MNSDSGGYCGTRLIEEPIKELGRASGSPESLARIVCCFINIELTVEVTEDCIRQVLPSASRPVDYISQGRSLVLHGVLLQVLTGFWEFGRTVCKLGPFTTQLSVTASSLTLCCIAFDRYVAVVHPLQLSTMQVRQNVSQNVMSLCLCGPPVTDAGTSLRVRERYGVVVHSLQLSTMEVRRCAP